MSSFAIIQTGGKQYIVEPGIRIRIEKVKFKEGGEVIFDSVLLHGSDKEVQLGKPHVFGVKVTGKVIGEGRGEKLIVYKYRRRKRTRVKKGHRQAYTEVEIISIGTEAKKDVTRAATGIKMTGKSVIKTEKPTAKLKTAVRKTTKAKSVLKKK